jgi:hypothetical protein
MAILAAVSPGMAATFIAISFKVLLRVSVANSIRHSIASAAILGLVLTKSSVQIFSNRAGQSRPSLQL